MSGRGDEAQPVTLQIVEGVIQRMDFKFAAVARAGVHLADGKASAQPVSRDLIQRGGKSFQLGSQRRRRLGQRLAQTLEQVVEHFDLPYAVKAKDSFRVRPR